MNRIKESSLTEEGPQAEQGTVKRKAVRLPLVEVEIQGELYTALLDGSE